MPIKPLTIDEMLNMRKRIVSCLILTLFVCLMLTSCEKKKEGPSTYELTGESVPSINNLLDGKGGVLSSEELPAEEGEEGTEGEGGEGGEGEEEAEAPETYVYHYEALPEGSKTVKAYVDALTASEIGFVIVNKAGRQTEAPDFTAEEGTLVLSRANLELRKSLIMDLSWKQDTLTVTIYLDDATAASASADGEAVEAMTANDAVAYLESLTPSLLGLPGTSMREYHVYYLDGKAIVDGVSCIRLRVYQISPPEGSNAILATYFLSPDKTNLYRLIPETNELETISLPL